MPCVAAAAARQFQPGILAFGEKHLSDKKIEFWIRVGHSKVFQTLLHILDLIEKWLLLVKFLLLVSLIGWVGAITTKTEIPLWYANLHKPAWNPPNEVFGPVWTLLYIIIAIVGWRLWRKVPGRSKLEKFKSRAVQFYFIQLFLNAAWSPIFFGMHRIELALIDIYMMIIFVVLTMRAAKPVDIVSFWLLAPYLAWIAYASTLNAAIVWLN